MIVICYRKRNQTREMSADESDREWTNDEPENR
jgi:hypothetical protein